MEIPLRNIKKEITGYALVSPEHFEEINKFKWYSDKEKYIKGTINKQSWRLHRYIILEIMKQEIPKEHVVDHKDNDPFNNTIDNIHVVPQWMNSQNRSKKSGCSSIYMGVSKLKDKEKYHAEVRFNGNRFHAYYDNEIHAAHQYNLWIDEHGLITAKRNMIEIPTDFVKWVSKISLKELPTGITKSGKKFQAIIYSNDIRENLGKFDQLEDAIKARKEAEEKKLKITKENLLETPKTFNKEGQCIFKTGDNEVIIDENMFYDIIQYSWRITSNGYVQGGVNGKTIKLARYIMEYNGELYVDHKNNNKLDNRKSNLEIVDPLQNSRNKSANKNSTSQYVGVSLIQSSKRWLASIHVNNNSLHLGSFEKEIDAAKARDIATIKYYSRGKMNFPEDYINEIVE